MKSAYLSRLRRATSCLTSLVAIALFGLLPVRPATAQHPLEVSENPFEFGSVEIGESMLRSLTLSVSDTAETGVHITGFYIETIGDSAFSAESSRAITLGPGQSDEIEITFSPSEVGDYEGLLIIEMNEPDDRTIEVVLYGTGEAIPRIEVHPIVLDFHEVRVDSSEAAALTIENSGTADLKIEGLRVEGTDANSFEAPSFRLSMPPSGSPIQVVAIFEPTITGNHDAILVIESNDPQNPEFPVDLTGVGVAPNVSTDPRSLSFGEVGVGNSSTLNLSVQNLGSITLNVYGLYITGADSGMFTIPEGGFSVEPNSTRMLPVTFSPEEKGEHEATLEINSDDPDTPILDVPLKGTGTDFTSSVPDISVVPSQLIFGEVRVGDSVTDELRIDNHGSSELVISSIAVSGPGAAGFGVEKSELVIAPNSSESLTITFSPSAAGDYAASVVVHSNDPDEPAVTIETSGTAIAPKISVEPETLPFGDVTVGEPFGHVVRIYNVGSAPLAVERIFVSGPDSDNFSVTEDGFILDKDRSRTRIVTFTPTSEGPKEAVLRVESDGGSASVALNGFGLAPRISLSDATLEFGIVPLGASSELNVDVSNEGGAALVIEDLFITGNGTSFDVALPLPAEIAPEATESATISFAPEAVGEFEATLTIVSNDPERPQATVSLSGEGRAHEEPRLHVEIDATDFGNVVVGQWEERSVTISNTGTVELTVHDLSTTDAQNFVVKADPPIAVPPNRSESVSVRFEPLTRGSKSAMLEIGSDGGDASVALTGRGLAPVIRTGADAIKFGTVAIGLTAIRSFDLENSGDATLQVELSVLSGPDAEAFVLVDAPSLSVPAGESREVAITFAPTQEGAATATLRLTHNDPERTPIELTLEGRGQAIQDRTPPIVHVDQRVDVTIDVPDELEPDAARLHYRLGGTQEFEPPVSLTRDVDSGSYVAAIPSRFLTVRGLQYYVEFEAGGQMLTIPASNARQSPRELRVEVDAVAEPVGAAAPVSYRMISVPAELDDPSPANVLTDDYGEYDPQRWRLFRWEDGEYVEFPETAGSFEAGTAFWLITRDGAHFETGAATSISVASSFPLVLEPGYNMIANPFAFPVAWNDVQFEGAVDDPVAYDGTEMLYGVERLEPWKGYFVYNASEGAVEAAIPPHEASAAKSEGNAGLAAVGDSSYVVRISARVPGALLRDTQNWIGLSNTEHGAISIVEAPAPGPRLRLSLVRDKLRYAALIEAGRAARSWHVEVGAEELDVSGRFPIDITLENRGRRPEGFGLYVLDRDRGKRIDVTDGTFELEITPSAPIRRLKIILATPADALLHSGDIPLEHFDDVLRQNHPNPFNPSTRIPYELTERRHVRIVIYDVLGRQVRLLRNEEQEAGRHDVTWDGRDSAGKVVASGVYMYRLEAGSFVASRQMVLLR